MIDVISYARVLESNKNPKSVQDLTKRMESIPDYMLVIRSILKNNRIASLFYDQFTMETSGLSGTPNEVYLKTLILRRMTETQGYMEQVVNPAYTIKGGVNLGKLVREIGSGVAVVEPSQTSKDLLRLGVDDDVNLTNYDAPGGTLKSRWAVATILNSSAEHTISDTEVFEPGDVALTVGATEAIDVSIKAIERCLPQSDKGKKKAALILPAYYTQELSLKAAGFEIIDLSEDKIEGNVRSFFPSLDKITKTLPSDSLFVLTLPNNPTGETYDNNFLKGLFNWAKKNGVIIIIDLLFDQLYFDKDEAPNPVKIATETDALRNIVFINGFAKSDNIAGVRTGFLGTKNNQVMAQINNQLLERRCTPPLTTTPLYQFEALANASILESEATIGNVRKALSKKTGIRWLPDVDQSILERWYQARKEWKQNLLQYYKNNLAAIIFCIDCLQKLGINSGISANTAGFNTLITWDSEANNNGFDRTGKTVLSTGVIPMDMRALGVEQKKGEYTFRVTYGGISQEEIAEIFTRLIAFQQVFEEGLR